MKNLGPLLFSVLFFTLSVALPVQPTFAQEAGSGGEEPPVESAEVGQDYLSEIGQNIADILPEDISFTQTIIDFYGLPETFFDFLPEGFWLYILIGIAAICLVILI